MWLLIFIYLLFLVLVIIISEIYLHRTKGSIRYQPIFGRALYFCSLFSWVGALLTYTLSNQSFWLGVAILIPLSFVFFLFSLLLFFTYYEINSNSLIKRILFIKKEYKYEDFAIFYSVGRIVATSSKTGKELFAFTSFHTNVELFLKAYVASVQTKEIDLESKVVRSNKIIAYFGLWIGILGLGTLALGITFIIPNLFGQPIPLGLTIIFWILAILELSFSIYCWLSYLFHYLVIDNGNIIVHKPFLPKKTYDHRNLHLECNYYMMKLKDEKNKVVFIIIMNFTENFFILFDYLDKK